MEERGRRRSMIGSRNVSNIYERKRKIQKNRNEKSEKQNIKKHNNNKRRKTTTMAAEQKENLFCSSRTRWTNESGGLCGADKWHEHNHYWSLHSHSVFHFFNWFSRTICRSIRPVQCISIAIYWQSLISSLRFSDRIYTLNRRNTVILLLFARLTRDAFACAAQIPRSEIL